ncbi:phosphatidylcholine/phosphatidylserine synthase [Lutibacter sp.]|uniref:CDP-alcohol phosphatidyltransferase family protein n=1 Tax=Lutibacter sp. TaxID=1925666 RepID=UPI00356ABEBE
MNIKKSIPNIFTLLNLLSGTIGVIFAVQGELVIAAYLVFLGIFFDFFDGFFARLLNVQGELGKQLDSLADVVTSGVVPGIVMFQLLNGAIETGSWFVGKPFLETSTAAIISFSGLAITLAAAYRLAKFNIDERQTSSFIGLPTPASAMVVLSLPLILEYSSFEIASIIIHNKWFLVSLTAVLCYLMNAEIPLFSLKFKNYKWKDNQLKFIFLIATIILIAGLKFIAIPLVILMYIIFSLFYKEHK